MLEFFEVLRNALIFTDFERPVGKFVDVSEKTNLLNFLQRVYIQVYMPVLCEKRRV